MKIRELLRGEDRRPPIVVPPDMRLQEFAECLREHQIGGVIVMDQDQMVGVATERDLVRAVADYCAEFCKRSVEDIMTRKVITCSPEDHVTDTLEVLNTRHIRHAPVIWAGKPIAMLSIRDFEQAYKYLKEQADTDELTGLPNRRSLMRMLERELNRQRRYGGPLAVAMIDIDHFKRVNDTYGHETGDRVLQMLGQMLRNELRSVDGIGRLGGEEFAVVLPQTELTDAVKTCERLLAVCRRQRLISGGNTVRVTLSCGITAVNPTDMMCDSILRRADVNLYLAKTQGRDRIISSEQSEQMIEKLSA